MRGRPNGARRQAWFLSTTVPSKESAIDTIRVLVYGGLGDGACDYYRLGMYVDYLAQLGVEIEPWTPRLRIPGRYGGRWYEALRDGAAGVELDDLGEANVVYFSRWSNTSPACSECGLDCGTPEGLARHRKSSGHPALEVDPLLRPLVASLLGNETIRGRCGVLYDLDDDLFHQPDWVGHRAGLTRELDLVELLIRSADLVTVATPALKAAISSYTQRTHVIRNAVEPGLYVADPPQASVPASDPGTDSGASEQPRVLFCGAAVRAQDYELCRSAVDEVAATSRIRRIWLGAAGSAVGSLVDETHPYVPAGSRFARRLASLRPDIGLAPLGEGEFGRAKSELHWLEYSAVGAATVASRLHPSGPYDVIRDGVDGFLAESPAEWRRCLADLVADPARRGDTAERARERMIAEYSAADRAVEWAAVYRWVASHPGAGLATL